MFFKLGQSIRVTLCDVAPAGDLFAGILGSQTSWNAMLTQPHVAVTLEDTSLGEMQQVTIDGIGRRKGWNLPLHVGATLLYEERKEKMRKLMATRKKVEALHPSDRRERKNRTVPVNGNTPSKVDRLSFSDGDCSLADRTVNPTLSNMLNKFVFLSSNTIIGQDGRVHRYCGLRLADIPASGTDLKQTGTSSALKYAHMRVRRRAAAKKPPKGAALTSSGVLAVYHTLGPPSYQCSMCNVTMWYNERSDKARKAVTPTFSLCCQEGKVLLPRFNDTPQPLKKLLDYIDPTTSRFKDQITVYNSMFCFTSFGARIDHSVNSGRGPYTFRINGQNYHRMGSLLLAEGVPPRLRLLSERPATRQYNAPTVSEVKALIINDFGDGLPTRDIIVNKNNTGPQRISELHPSYMVLQYPLLFLYGEDGYHEKIPYHSNGGNQKTKRGHVTMKEYYAYIIQQQKNQGTTLLRGGRLFQQYLVDAFTAIEEQRLNWTRNNQDTLRVDLYHNLCDAVTRGDTSAAGLGKRIVLPWTFTSSPRYMMQNYQDAMALCRAYSNPDLIITFTSNPKWPKIAEMLAYVPDQNSVTLRDSENLPALLEREGINLTMFIEWFELNKEYPEAREYTYAEIPQHYVWHAKEKKWMPQKLLDIRKRLGHPVFEGSGIFLSPSAPNAPSKTPSTVATSSSSIDSKLKSPTSSTSPSTNGYLTSTISSPQRVPPPPPTQENGSMDITLTLSPITLFDIQFNTPSPSIPSPSLFGHPISRNLLEAHGATCLCCIQNRRLILGLSEELQYMLCYIQHMLSQTPPPNSPPPPSLSPN
ncbi:ATP-dependent DNA helicase PIF1 [Tanacetum coccineum]